MANIKDLRTAIGYRKQAAIGTVLATAANFATFTQRNRAIPALQQNQKTNVDEIGAGAFATTIYKLNRAFDHPIEVIANSRMAAILFAFGLGNVAKTAAGDGFQYVCTPTTAADSSLETTSFWVGLYAGSADEVHDDMHIGVGVEEVALELTAGLQEDSAKITAQLVGGGKVTLNSGFAPPSLVTPNFLNFGNITTLTVCGIDMSSGFRMNTLKIAYKNNRKTDKEYRLGAGLSQNGFAIGARIVRGNPSITISGQIEVSAGSSEQAAFLAGTGGAMDVRLTGPNMGPGATNPESIRIQAPDTRFTALPEGEDSDQVVYNFEAEVFNTTGSPFTVTINTPLNNVHEAE
jgi:hypothetical protein